MSDLIKREDAVSRTFCTSVNGVPRMVILLDDIKALPTIDAVIVVRCKECKWAKAYGTYQWCGRLDSTAKITADDFCSYGEPNER